MKTYRTIFRLIKEAWSTDKKYFLLLFLLSIVQTVIAIVTMYLPSSIIKYIEEGKSVKDTIILIMIFILGIYLLKQVQSTIQMFYQKALNFQSESLAVKLSEKTMNVSFDNLENTENLDLIQRAKMPISWGFINMTLTNIKNVFVAIITILGLLSVLINHSVLYTLIIFLILIISSFITVKVQKKRDKTVQQNVPVNRKYGYLIDTALGDENQKEFRIYGINKIWNSKMRANLEEVFVWVDDLIRLDHIYQIMQTVTSSLIIFIAISYNGSRLFSDMLGPIIGVSTFTLIFNSTNKVMTCVQDISGAISTINMGNAHLTPWRQYLDLEDFKNLGSKEASDLETLEFRNVTFSYPNTNRIILDDISFKINKGEKISIVGLNNAGKSTIIKLISRFYQADSGEILWNGVNINDYEINSYIKEISAVFQDFKLMPYSIFENVMSHGDDREKAEESLKEVNMYDAVSKLESGMDTYLSKDLEEDSTRFSGGQTQKLAIARSINKGGSLMIMDEPTAALDPIAESEIFEKFANLTENKTSIFISHRMSSSTFSDKVLLLDGGKVVGFDSHKNLMNGHNLYRKLFETQAKNYL